MEVRITTIRLPYSPLVRIGATVTDERGRPLVRRVVCYDMAYNKLSEEFSDSDGQVRFVLAGNVNDRWVLRAIGHRNECDDISCPLQGEFV